MMIGIRVLGPLEVRVGAGLAHVGGPRQRCVLARLVAAHGEVVSADRLIEDLYAGEAPPKALAAVQSYVSHLRRALEPGRAAWDRAGVLAASPPGYALRLGPEAVDAWVFETGVHAAAGLEDPAAAHARLSAALACWRGPAYQEFTGQGWADLEASRLGELRLTAIEARAGAALRLGRAARIVPELDQLATEHPLREEAWRLLALALYQCGRQGDALAALRRARARLAEELGVDPGPALRELEEGILAQAPRLAVPAALTQQTRPAATAGPHPDPAPAAAAYVGRDAELDQVLAAAAGAAAGRGRIVLVTGEAGAGKTALADRVSARLAAEGWMVTAGRCPEHEGAPAGWPWAEALQRLAVTVPPAEPHPLAPLLADSPVPDGDAAAARFRLHQAIGRYLESLSRAAPLLVVLDDLHRADSETLTILTHVTADLAASSVLVLASYRPAEAGEPLSACLAALARREPARVTLRGLDAAAARELIRAVCTRPVDEATARTIAERTGGNPFFIKETALLLDSEGELAAVSGVPAGVREVLRRRIARLPVNAQTILRQASVIGAETDVGVLGDVAAAEDHELLDAVEAGLIAGLVTEPEPDRVRFTHALIRDTFYQDQSRLRRSRLHARAAKAVERRRPGEVAALAYHFAEAGTDPVKAARYSRLAAEQAEQKFAYSEAARMWEQAVTCLDQAAGASARDRLELVLGLVGALSQAGQVTRARSLRKDAVRAALPLRDPALVARVITAFNVPRAWFFREYGETDHELVGMVERTLLELPPGDHPLRCGLLTTLAFELEDAESERGYEASGQAVQMARRLGDPVMLTMALGGRWAETHRDHGLDERLSIGSELLVLPGKPVTADAIAHLVLMTSSCGAADFGAADRHAAEAARIAGRYGLPTVAAAVTMYRAMRAALDGDPAAAGELYREAATQLDGLGLREQGALVGILGQSSVLIMQDRAAEITSELDGYKHLSAVFSELYALKMAAAGRVAEAREAAAHPLPIPGYRGWLFGTAVRGLLGIALDDRDRATSAYQDLLPFAARPTGADSLLVTLWPVAQILGDLARYLVLPGAEAHYEHALAIAERAHVGPWRDAAASRLRERQP